MINAGSSEVALTLPVSPTLGDTYQVVGYASGGWIVNQNAGQSIFFSETQTTVGTSGYAASVHPHDRIQITYAASNTFIGVVLVSTSGITIN